MGLKSKQIMLIDDDEVIRILLTRVLNTVGCTVESCFGIKDALVKLKTTTPDLIILDLNMPELDGFTFLKFRYLNSMLASIPVLVLSGTKNKAEVQKALAMGANQFLEKPFEARIVLQKLRFIFSSQETFTYRFAEGESPMVEVEIRGAIVEQCVSRLKIESQVRFGAGKSLQILSEDYLKNGGSPVVCRVDAGPVDLRDGFFRAVLTATGLDTNEKKQFELWERTLSE